MYETVQIVRCNDCVYSVKGHDDKHVICAMHKCLREGDFFCKDCSPKRDEEDDD